MKVMLSSTLFLILLISGFISYSNLLHGNEVVQYLLNYKHHSLNPPHFGKFFQSSTKGIKNSPMAETIFLKKVISFE